MPGKAAIARARQRLGVEPLEMLYRAVAVPLAMSETVGTFYRGWRLVSLDGSCLDVAAYWVAAPLTLPVKLKQNVGMSHRDADILRHASSAGTPVSAARDPVAALRDVGITAFFRPSQLPEAGLTRNQLPALLRSGRVERVARGLYRIADAEATENDSLAMACARVPNSVVCLLTALRVYEIGTQSPADVWLAIRHKARVPRLPELRLRTVRFSGPAWTFGVRETRFEGVAARITSPARTVADCFRFERLVGAEVALEAFHDALRQRKVTIAELSRVVEVLPSRRLSAALDVVAM
ncbi:MAG: hypothetical protein U5K81_13865 [Trueperaceae bacterium]|nr:hypothetical protein [Trueperaceae bacterium]